MGEKHYRAVTEKQREIAEAKGDRIVNLATLRTVACSQARVSVSGALDWMQVSSLASERTGLAASAL